MNHDPARSGPRNLRAWCQRCHLAHDRPWHLLQRWISYRLRYACGDLFLGPYRHGPSAAVLLGEILAHIAARLAQPRGAEPRPGARRIAQGAGRALFQSGVEQRRQSQSRFQQLRIDHRTRGVGIGAGQIGVGILGQGALGDRHRRRVRLVRPVDR